MERNMKKKIYIYICVQLTHFVIHLKLTQYCKSTLSIKNKWINEKNYNPLVHYWSRQGMARIPNTVPILALCALSPQLMAPSLSRCHPPNAVLDALPTGKPPGLSLGLSKMPPTTTSFWTRQDNLCAQRGTALWPLKAPGLNHLSVFPPLDPKLPRT